MPTNSNANTSIQQHTKPILMSNKTATMPSDKTPDRPHANMEDNLMDIDPSFSDNQGMENGDGKGQELIDSPNLKHANVPTKAVANDGQQRCNSPMNSPFKKSQQLHGATAMDHGKTGWMVAGKEKTSPTKSALQEGGRKWRLQWQWWQSVQGRRSSERIV